MKKTLFYGLMFCLFSVALFITANYYLENELLAAAGDTCECGCDADAWIFCYSTICWNHQGCDIIIQLNTKCDNGIYCVSHYVVACGDPEDDPHNLTCSNMCSSCDKSFLE